MENVHKLLVAAIVASISVGNLSAESVPAWKKVVPSATSIAQGNAVYNEFVADHSHLGVDIMARCGEPIYPLFSGKVKKIAKDTNGLGYAIMIEHDNELYTIVLHMQGLPNVEGELLRVGDSIDSVRSIGKIGDTGFAEGCHTHFEIRNFYHEYNIVKGFLDSSNDGWYHNRSKRCSDGRLNIYACGDVSSTTWAKTDWENPETFMVDVEPTIPAELQALMDGYGKDYAAVFNKDQTKATILAHSDRAQVPYSEVDYTDYPYNTSPNGKPYCSDSGYDNDAWAVDSRMECGIFVARNYYQNSDGTFNPTTHGVELIHSNGSYPNLAALTPSIYTCRDDSGNVRYIEDGSLGCAFSVLIVHSKDNTWYEAVTKNKESNAPVAVPIADSYYLKYANWSFTVNGYGYNITNREFVGNIDIAFSRRDVKLSLSIPKTRELYDDGFESIVPQAQKLLAVCIAPSRNWKAPTTKDAVKSSKYCGLLSSAPIVGGSVNLTPELQRELKFDWEIVVLTTK